MTFAVLRALHGIIGEALDDIERVYHAHGAPTSNGVAAAAAADHQNNCDGDRTRELSASKDSSPYSPHNSPRSSTHAKGSNGGNAKSMASASPRGGRHRSSLSSSSVNAIISRAYVSPPPSPCVAKAEQRFEQRMPTRPPTAASLGNPTPSTNAVDFPSLDTPFDPTSPSEALATHPAVLDAINRAVAACGQITATVQTPFLTICDSTMGYHLPSCMRIIEAAHVVEIIREFGSPGLHVDRISQLCGIDASKLAHILRLLATHHIFREVSVDTFALNRIASLIDSGKSVEELVGYRFQGLPELKYQGTNGIAAFVGLCSDEINKASAYMAETYLLSSSPRIREATQPTLAPFCFAFGAVDRNVDYFGWLEGQNDKLLGHEDRTEQGHGSDYAPANGLPDPAQDGGETSSRATPLVDGRNPRAIPNLSRFRLERFGKAMSGTESWEAPGAVFKGFDWGSLPRGSIVVDVGGGIGSTSMMLATAFTPPTGTQDLGLKFVIQDRAFVVEMGEKAWREKCPELLRSETARFQVHDFFKPQPIKNAAVFLLRVVMHDWPDDHARKILVHLREAAMPTTKLLLGDFVLPLACADDLISESGLLEQVEGAQSVLAPAPLLPNLGKASANVYWMDLTMNVMFNSRERTLREIVALALSAGWKVVKVHQAPGSLFGYITAVPIPRPGTTEPSRNDSDAQELSYTSLSGSPLFASRVEIGNVKDALAKFGGGVKRHRGPGTIGRGLGASVAEPEKQREVVTEKASEAEGANLIGGDRRRTTSTSAVLASPTPQSSTSSLSGDASTAKAALGTVTIVKLRSAFDVRSSFRSGLGDRRSVDSTSTSSGAVTSVSTSSSSSLISSTAPVINTAIPSAKISTTNSLIAPTESTTISSQSSRGVVPPRIHLNSITSIPNTRSNGCSSPSPINMQIATAPRTAPPLPPPKSLRRPSSLASIKAAKERSFLNGLGDPPLVPVPPLPVTLQGSPITPTVRKATSMAEGLRACVDPPLATPSPPRSRPASARRSGTWNDIKLAIEKEHAALATASGLAIPASPVLPAASPVSPQRMQQLRTRASYAHFSSGIPSRVGTPVGQGSPIPVPAPARVPVAQSVHYAPAPRGSLLKGREAVEKPKGQSGVVKPGESRGPSSTSQSRGLASGIPTPVAGLAEAQRVLGKAGFARRASSATLSSNYKTLGGSVTDFGNERNGGIGGTPVSASPKAVRVLGSSIPISMKGFGSSGGDGSRRRGVVAGFMRGAGQRIGGMLRFESHGKGEEKEKEKEKMGVRRVDVRARKPSGAAAAGLMDSVRVRERRAGVGMST